MKKEDAFDASEVTNWLLARYDCNQFELTNLKVNKLLYFLHGVCLAREGYPLVRNRFECWEHGPVIPAVFHRLKKFGRGYVTEPISVHRYSADEVLPVEFGYVERRLSETIKKASDYFVGKSVTWLVNESHRPDGPWFKVRMGGAEYNRHGTLADVDIKEHFENIYGGRRLH